MHETKENEREKDVKAIRKIALDTNCLLDAADVNSLAHGEIMELLGAEVKGRIELFVSLHSLSELTKDDPITMRAREIGSAIHRLPYYPIGAWKDQVGAWNQLAGSWQDAHRNQQVQNELSSLAKSGNDIRDRGAYIDALLAGMQMFVTSDRQLVGSGPATRIEKRFGLRILSPSEIVSELRLSIDCTY
ncbi:MAG: hypothetical protein ABSH41_15470 [Syntrophobacteraceae bacterium]